MKTFLSILCLGLILSCNSKKSTPEIQSDGISFYVGSYTNKDSKGIYKYKLNSEGFFSEIGLQTLAESPSFLSFSADKKHLIAANKLDPKPGSISSFTIEGDSLILNNIMPSGGMNPCFVTTTKDNYVLAANYGSGNVSLLQLDQNGHLSDTLSVQQHTGKGTTSRQEGPHAHAVYSVPNSDDIISVDLGTNSLWFYNIDKNTNTLNLSTPDTLAMEEGAGPRHLTFHPNNKWIYVLNELNNTVTKIERLATGQYEKKESTKTLPSDFTASSTSADIHISSDGLFLYTSNRGHNSIAVFKVNPNNGSLTMVDHEPTRGETPRNFSLSPDEKFVVVANRNSDNLVSYKRNKETGILTFVDEIKSPTPSFILFQ